jgi:glycosyltransferase involved in cell wall biosynthesis
VRIGFVGTGRNEIPPKGYGGVERTIWEISSELRRRGHQTMIFDMPHDGTSWRRWLLGLPRRLERSGVDVVHVHHQSPALRLALLGPRFVFTPHLATWFEDQTTFWNRLSMTRDRLAFGRAAAVTVMNVPFYEKIRATGIGNPVYVPLGINPEEFKATGPGNPEIALSVGIVGRRKRWHIAARGLVGTGIRYRIVGPIKDPVYANELRALGAEIVGEVSNARLRAEYEDAGFLVHPSIAEILPGVVLQAMSFSRPVIVSGNQSYIEGTISPRNGSDEERVVEDLVRKTALDFKRNDSERIFYGERARTVVEDRFSIERVTDEYLEVYEKCRV